MTFAAFFLLAAAVVGLPFVPAIVEWRRRTDATPLKVDHESTVSIRHFARRFEQYVEENLRAHVDACRARGTHVDVVLPDRTPCLVVPAADANLLTDAEIRARATTKVILSCSDLELPEGVLFSREIHAVGSVFAGSGALCRAILAEGDLHLFQDVTVLRWAHARGNVHVGPGSVLYGRLSSDRSIRLEPDCRFERLNAPRIECAARGSTWPSSAPPSGTTDREPLRHEDIPNVIDVAGGRWLIRRRLRLPPGALVRSDLVVTGSVTIGRGARIEGSIKSHADLHLEAGVVVTGSVVSGSRVVLDAGCHVRGPILAEEAIYLRAGNVAGTPDKPTTISARRIWIEPGTIAHGTIWARDEAALVSSTEGWPR